MDKVTLSTGDNQGPLNATAAAMLGLLDHVSPLNGNVISWRARDIIGDFWTLTRSQVDRELQTLEKNNCVHAGPLGRVRVATSALPRRDSPLLMNG